MYIFELVTDIMYHFYDSTNIISIVMWLIIINIIISFINAKDRQLYLNLSREFKYSSDKLITDMKLIFTESYNELNKSIITATTYGQNNTQLNPDSNKNLNEHLEDLATQICIPNWFDQSDLNLTLEQWNELMSDDHQDRLKDLSILMIKQYISKHIQKV